MKKLNIKTITELWKKEKKEFVKISTYSTYITIINKHILPYFENKNQFCESEVQEFVNLKINQGLSIKTIKDIIVIIKMILKYSIKNGYMKYAEINTKLPPPNEIKQLEVLSTHDYKKLINYTKQNFTFKNLGILICLSTGMRIGEICGLKWEDIDINLGVIKVARTRQRVYIPQEQKTLLLETSPKTLLSCRQIPISTELLKIVKPLKKIVNSNFYVLTNLDSPTEPRSYRNYFKNLIKKLEIKNYKFHTLRHSFASKCVDAKCDYKTLSVILGHSNVNTTLNIYVHPSHEQKKKCIDKMLKQVM